MTRVVAVVPSLGLAPGAGRALAALRAELARAHGALVWVHQGVAGEPPELFPPAERLLRLPRRAGFARAVNTGIAAARAAGAVRIALVNDDATVEPGWLADLDRALDDHPEAAAAQGVILLEERPALADGWGLGWNRWHQAVQLGHGEAPPPASAEACEVFGVSATAALYRAAALAELGERPFDERLDSYYEDADLAVRLRALGHAALSVPAARARHGAGATARRRPARRWAWIQGNRWAVVARAAGRRFPLLLPALAARDLADLARALAEGDGARAAGILGGFARAAWLLPRFARAGAPWPPFAPSVRSR